MNEVATHMGNKTTMDDRGTKNGKKRAKEMEPTEKQERKRVKVDEGPSDKPLKIKIKINLKKVPKQTAQSGRAHLKVTKNSTAFIEPKWKVFQPIKTPTPPYVTQSQEQPSLTELKPRIWTSRREELVVLLPELAGPKCLNGVSWLMYETPMVLLDESTACFDISLQEDSVTLDLLTTREFTCTWPRAEKMPDPPENNTPDGNHSNLGTTVTSSSKSLPKTQRTKKSASTAPTSLTAGSTFSLPLPTNTPHEPSIEGFKAWSEQFIPLPLPTYSYSQYGPPVESVSQSYGTGTKVLAGAAGLRKEMPEGVLIDFSLPSIPSYAVHRPVAGGFSEPVRDAQSIRGIGNTVTKYPSSSSIRPLNPTTKIREQNHSTNDFIMSTDPPLQTDQVVNDWSNIFMGHQSQGRLELANNQPLSSQSGKRSHDFIKPLPHRRPPYETKYTVSTDTNFTSPRTVNKILTQACHAFRLPQPSDNMELDTFKSNTCAAITTSEVARTQLSSANIALNAGPVSRMQNASLAGMKLVPLSVTPNYHNTVTDNQIELDLNKLHSSDPTTPKIGPQVTETVESNQCSSDEAKVKQIRDLNQDTFIPSTIPPEIQAIIDSYLSGRPVLLIISNKRFFDYWSLRLPQEFGFSMLGYFRILGVQESRVHLDDPALPLEDRSGLITGRVKWRFRLQWSPGGEEWILPNHDKDLLEHPWWKPPPPPSIPPLEAQVSSLDTQSTDNLIINPTPPSVSQEIPASETPPLVVSTLNSQSTGDKGLTTTFEPEGAFDTTPRYRAARLSNVNYKFRHAHLRELYHSLVPLQLLAPYGRTVLDSSFPRGWLCKSCGKMNFQAALRHRMCSSSFCKGLEPEIAPYAIELIFMRDPQDNLSMVLPYNEPLLINLVDTWEDGTRTLPYYIHDDKNIFIKHIFSRNLPLLQVEATRLLHFIQLEVELVRPIGENSPYFQYSARAPNDDPSPTTSEWPNVPLSIHHAKDWTQHQAIWFGELKEEQLSINHLCLLAWVSSGTKRGPTTICAKEKCVVFHAFGCNITVMVSPLSSKTKTTAPVKVDGVDIDSLNLITMDDLPPDEPDANPGWIAGLDEDGDAVEGPSQEEKEPAINSKKTSNSKRPFLFTLVHGDVLVFYGDDFEYSLKRGGTSFLLIMSHQNEP